MATKRAHGTRRVWLPAACLGLFAIAVALRLVKVQVLQHDAFAEQAAAELSGSSTSFAQRGAILDRNGNVLAASVDTWRCSVSVALRRSSASSRKLFSL